MHNKSHPLTSGQVASYLLIPCSICSHLLTQANSRLHLLTLAHICSHLLTSPHNCSCTFRLALLCSYTVTADCKFRHLLIPAPNSSFPPTEHSCSHQLIILHTRFLLGCTSLRQLTFSYPVAAAHNCSLLYTPADNSPHPLYQLTHLFTPGSCLVVPPHTIRRAFAIVLTTALPRITPSTTYSRLSPLFTLAHTWLICLLA